MRGCAHLASAHLSTFLIKDLVDQYENKRIATVSAEGKQLVDPDINRPWLALRPVGTPREA